MDSSMIIKIKKLMLTSLLTIVSIANSCFANNTDWAQQDLLFMHDAIRDNHPGMYNEYDPQFKDFLTLQYKATLNKLKSCTNDSEKIALLRSFVASFDDAHLRIEGKAFHQQSNTTQEARQQCRTFGITKLNNNVCWISLPTFEPNAQEQVSLKTITLTLEKQLRLTPCIVFDIRGNRGGNPMFARNIVQALFGQEYTRYYLEKLYSKVAVDWRASKANIAYFTQLKEKNSNDPKQTNFVQWLTHVIDGMQHALDEGKPYFRQQNNTQLNDAQQQPINPLRARIVVIVDGDCISTALDFIDYLKAMNHNVVLMGQTTGSDSLYMDVNQVPLPSGKGTLIVPMKIYRKRPRGQNESYIPDVTYYDDMHDTSKMQHFVINNLLPHLDTLISIMAERNRRTSWSGDEFKKMFEDHIRVAMHITYGDRCQNGDQLVEKVITQALDLNEAINTALHETVAFAINLFKVAHDIDQVDSCYYLCRTMVGMCGQSMDQALEYMQQYAQTFPPVCLFGSTAHTNGYEKIYCTYLVPMIQKITKDCPQSSNVIIQKAIKLCKIGVTQKDAVRFATVLAHAGADDKEYIEYQYHLYYAATHYLKKDANEALKLVLRCAMPMMTEEDFVILMSKLDYKEPWWDIACPELKEFFPEEVSELEQD